MIKKAGFKVVYAVMALLNVGIIQEAHAFRTSLGAAVGAEYSDNIGRTATNQQDEFTRIGMIGLSLEEDSRSVTADVEASLRYEDFAKDTFNNRSLFNLASQAEWRILPDRFSWTITDDFRQVRVDSTDPSTPDNTQDSNVFSTGPDVFFRFGAVNRLELGARYIDNRFEVSTSNSKRYTTSATWRYTPISERELSLNIDAEKAEFETVSSDSDFIRVDYSLAFVTRTAQSELEFEIGWTTVKRDELEDFNGTLLGLHWTWSPTRLSTFDFSATSKITDSGRNLLAADSDTSQGIIETEQIGPDLFRERRVELAYIRDGYDLSTEFSVYLIDRDYKTAPLDREIFGAFANVSYNLAASLVLLADAEYQQTKVLATNEQFDDLLFGVGLGYLFRRNLTLELRVDYLKRDSNQFGSSYDEFRALVGVAYGIGTVL